jgi:hypothetical protein
MLWQKEARRGQNSHTWIMPRVMLDGVTLFVSLATIRASNQNKTLTISNSDTQARIKTVPLIW